MKVDDADGGPGVRLTSVLRTLADIVARLEPERLEGVDARTLTEMFARGERLCAAGKALAARRVAQTGAWQESGERSAAGWLGRVSGAPTGQAADVLASAEQVRDQPEVDDALRAGELSAAQASAVSNAAAKTPSTTPDLLGKARSDSLAALKDRCRQVETAADEMAEKDRYRRIHAGRYLRSWTDDDGAGRLSARLTPDALAVVTASLAGFQEAVFAQARAAGSRERRECYAADALVVMAAVAAAPTTRAASAGESATAATPAESRPASPKDEWWTSATRGGSQGLGDPGRPGGPSASDRLDGSGGLNGSAGSDRFDGSNCPDHFDGSDSSTGSDGSDDLGGAHASSGSDGVSASPATPDSGAAAPGPGGPAPPHDHDPGAGRRNTMVIVRVDHAALIRGWRRADECCDIDGVGPVPVATVRAMMTDAYVAAVVSDGVNVRSVVHLGRSVTALQRTALLARDVECVVPGCHVRWGLEIDHVEPWAATRVTRLDTLARLCHHHHGQKTYEGWTLTGRPGAWRWSPPADPSRNAPAAGPSGRPPPTPTSSPLGGATSVAQEAALF